MSVFRRLLNLALALALAAGGLAPGHAHGAMPEAPPVAAPSEPPCHEVAGAAEAPLPAGLAAHGKGTRQDPSGAPDCCKPGDCGCECLPHSPSPLLPPLALASRPPGQAWPIAASAALPQSPGHSLIRPPIA